MLFYQLKTELRRDSGWSQTCSCLHFVLNYFLLKDGMPAIHFYLSLVVQTNTKSAPRRLAQKTLKNWMHCNNYIQKQNANAADWHKCYVIRCVDCRSSGKTRISFLQEVTVMPPLFSLHNLKRNLVTWTRRTRCFVQFCFVLYFLTILLPWTRSLSRKQHSMWEKQLTTHWWDWLRRKKARLPVNTKEKIAYV